jgi:hypothetical protein
MVDRCGAYTSSRVVVYWRCLFPLTRSVRCASMHARARVCVRVSLYACLFLWVYLYMCFFPLSRFHSLSLYASLSLLLSLCFSLSFLLSLSLTHRLGGQCNRCYPSQ